MKKYIHLTLVLFVIASLSGLVIGTLYNATKEVIAENNYQKVAKGIEGIFTESDGFNDLDEAEESTFEANNVILSLYEVVTVDEEIETVIGYVFKINAPGSNSGTLEALIGFDVEGNVKGITYVNNLETAGADEKVATDDFINQFVGQDNTTDVDTITGATISSSAVINAVDYAQNYFKENIKE